MNKEFSERGLAARVLAGSVLVGSMGGCLGPVGGYIVGKEIARGQERAQYNDYVRQHNATTVDGRLWKGEPLESYMADFGKTFGHLEIHQKGIQFDTEGMTLGGRPIPFWWASIPYSSIIDVSCIEGRETFLGFEGRDELGVKWQDTNGRTHIYQFILSGYSQGDVEMDSLRRRILGHMQNSMQSSFDEALRARAIAEVNGRGITDPAERAQAVEKYIAGFYDGLKRAQGNK